ncbi:MAG: hypothetical protein HPY53_03150 [Brevinematales bacterium]|nr:hypothetical protein [Brevinematales bacterium]
MKKLIVFISFCVFISVSSMYAKKWDKPKAEKFYSANSNYCLLVQPSDGDTPCKGTLYQTGYKAGLLTVWSAKLVNPVSPVKALVTDNGKYVVTFDDWENPGTTDNMIVIYGTDGKLIKKYKINDFINNKLLENLTELEDGYLWYGGSSFEKDGEVFVFTIPLAGDSGNKTVKLLLKTGARTD